MLSGLVFPVFKTKWSYVKFRVLTVSSMKTTVYWDVAQCSLVENSPTFQRRLLPASACWYATSQKTVVFEIVIFAHFVSHCSIVPTKYVLPLKSFQLRVMSVPSGFSVVACSYSFCNLLYRCYYRILRSVVRFKVLRDLKVWMLFFWVVTQFGLVGRYQCFGEIYCLHLKGCLQVHAALQPRRLEICCY
jgi:hypothetical protein